MEREQYKGIEIKKQPKTVIDSPLPEISVGGRKIRLCMHTDTAGNFLRFLKSIPEAQRGALLVQVRIISPEQYEKLSKDPLFRFYFSSRV